MSIQRKSIGIRPQTEVHSHLINKQNCPKIYTPQPTFCHQRTSTSPGVITTVIRSISPPRPTVHTDKSSTFISNSRGSVPQSIYYLSKNERNIQTPLTNNSFRKINLNHEKHNILQQPCYPIPVLSSSIPISNSPKISFKYFSPSKKNKQHIQLVESKRQNNIQGQSPSKLQTNIEQNLSCFNSLPSQIKSSEPSNTQNSNIKPLPQTLQQQFAIQHAQTQTTEKSSQNKNLLNNYIYIVEENEDYSQKEREKEKMKVNQYEIQEKQKKEKEMKTSIISNVSVQSNDSHSGGQGKFPWKQLELVKTKTEKSDVHIDKKVPIDNHEMKYNEKNQKTTTAESQQWKQKEINDYLPMKKCQSELSQQQNTRKSMKKMRIKLPNSLNCKQPLRLSQKSQQTNSPLPNIIKKSNPKQQIKNNSLIKQYEQLKNTATDNIGSFITEESGKSKNQGIDKLKQDLIEKKMQNEKEFQYEMKLKEQDLYIKNLKNQVWIMKLRENQLINTIKKFQQLNENQMNVINKLKNKQK